MVPIILVLTGDFPIWTLNIKVSSSGRGKFPYNELKHKVGMMTRFIMDLTLFL